MDELETKARAAAELLEAIDEDRGLLADVSDEVRERLLIAAGQVSRPDKWARYPAQLSTKSYPLSSHR